MAGYSLYALYPLSGEASWDDFCSDTCAHWIRFLEPIHVLLVILLHTHLRLHLQILPVMVPSHAHFLWGAVGEHSPSELSSFFDGPFPQGVPPSWRASGSRAGRGLLASWAPRSPATSRSTVGGAQVPHCTLPVEGLAAAFHQTAYAIDPFRTESSPLRGSTQMWITMRREQFWGEGSRPALSEGDPQRLLWKPLLGGFGSHSPETTQVKTGSDSIYHTRLSLRRQKFMVYFYQSAKLQLCKLCVLRRAFVSAGALESDSFGLPWGSLPGRSGTLHRWVYLSAPVATSVKRGQWYQYPPWGIRASAGATCVLGARKYSIIDSNYYYFPPQSLP